MGNTSSKLTQKKRRDVAYHKQREKNLVFTQLIAFLAEEMERRGITKKDIAAAISKDPSQITRMFAGPSNFELDTLTEILLPFDARMEHRIVRFQDLQKPNFAHPAIASFIGVFGTTEVQPAKPTATEATTRTLRVKTVPPYANLQAKVKVSP